MREWIETNGLGGYTSLTSMHSNTRKFHGLLIASLNPPHDRRVFVSNCYDQIISDSTSIPLNPSHGNLTFCFFPSVSYENDVLFMQKTFLMHHLHNTTLVRYDLVPKKPFILRHHPLLTSRHFYQVHPHPSLFDYSMKQKEQSIICSPSNTEQSVTIFHPEHCSYHQAYQWEYHQYEMDQKRHDASEDYLLSIGYLETTISEPCTYYLVFTVEDEHIHPHQIFEQEKQRKKQLLAQSHLPWELTSLVLSSDQFIVRKKDKTTILAGYHWFSDWGRDTLIALPGLTLVTRRYDSAREILEGLQQTCHQGIIPNTYDDRTGEAAYNTVDASLWFIDRVYSYMKYTNDLSFLQQLYPTLESIIDAYRTTTMHDIGMDEDYLIQHGPGLTWMDVKLGEYYPTPRAGKAVEIQALWYHDLCIMDLFSQILDKPGEYDQLAQQVKTSFQRQYQKQYDVIDTKDDSCRPNKLFLVSLDHELIDEGIIRTAIVEDVMKRLITVFGPRTLSRDHPDYKGCYFGDYPRDITYHNGMVWPWLLGPFITAFIKTKNYSAESRTYAYDHFLKPLLMVYGDHWDGAIHEIFDGDPVYAPRGCINQAWSVAEPLRAYVEDILLKRPPYERTYRLDEIRV